MIYVLVKYIHKNAELFHYYRNLEMMYFYEFIFCFLLL